MHFVKLEQIGVDISHCKEKQKEDNHAIAMMEMKGRSKIPSDPAGVGSYDIGRTCVTIDWFRAATQLLCFTPIESISLQSHSLRMRFSAWVDHAAWSLKRLPLKSCPSFSWNFPSILLKDTQLPCFVSSFSRCFQLSYKTESGCNFSIVASPLLSFVKWSRNGTVWRSRT